MKYLFFALLSSAFLITSCAKNDETVDLRQLLFKENADSVTAALELYDFISDNQRTPLFTETFSANANLWPVYAQFTNSNNIDGFGSISNSEYYISGSENGLKNFTISKPIDTSKNFEISFRVKNEEAFGGTTLFSRQGLFFRSSITSGKLIGSAIILKGGSIKNFISFRRYYAATDDGTEYEIEIPTDYYYEVVLRKIKGRFSLFVNRKFVAQYDSSIFYAPGNLFGFGVNNRMRIDYVNVHYINF